MAEPAALELSESIEDYLKAIFELGGSEDPVGTSALAGALGISAASVTGMIRRLDRAGLVAHERYAGVRLTGPGEKVALEILRHHRLIETYLAEAMGLPWDKVHEEAHRLEHHISDVLEDRMAELLGHPERDPHGAPIPPKNGTFSVPEYGTLADAQSGEHLAIREVPDEDAEMLRYLDELGLRPDVEIAVLEVAPFEGPITVRVLSLDGEGPRTGGRRDIEPGASESGALELGAIESGAVELGTREPVVVGRALASAIAVERVT